MRKELSALLVHFALVAELPGAMADASSAAKPYWSDHEICMDRDGLPHYTGVHSHLMKEYRRRVLFAYGSLEGDGDTPEKEAADFRAEAEKVLRPS